MTSWMRHLLGSVCLTVTAAAPEQVLNRLVREGVFFWDLQRPDPFTCRFSVRRRDRQRAEELAKPFFDYYAAANWRDSENKPVYNWQQKFIAWKQRDEEKKRAQLARGLKPPEDTKPVDRSSELARMDRYLAKMREGT